MKFVLLILSIFYLLSLNGQNFEYCSYIGKKLKVFLNEIEGDTEFEPIIFRYSRYAYSLHFEYDSLDYFLVLDRSSAELSKEFKAAHRPIAPSLLKNFTIAFVAIGREGRMNREVLCQNENSNSVLLKVKLMNSYTNKPIINEEVNLNTDKYGFNSIKAKTNGKGIAYIQSTVKDTYTFFLNARKFVRKRSSYSHEYILNKQIVIYARPLSDSKLVADIDTNVIGQKVNFVLKKQKLRDLDITLIQEPPGKYRGVKFLDNTGNEIRLYIDRNKLNIQNIPRGPHRQEKILQRMKKLKIQRLLIWHP